MFESTCFKSVSSLNLVSYTITIIYQRIIHTLSILYYVRLGYKERVQSHDVVKTFLSCIIELIILYEILDNIEIKR